MDSPGQRSSSNNTSTRPKMQDMSRRAIARLEPRFAIVSPGAVGGRFGWRFGSVRFGSVRFGPVWHQSSKQTKQQAACHAFIPSNGHRSRLDTGMVNNHLRTAPPGRLVTETPVTGTLAGKRCLTGARGDHLEAHLDRCLFNNNTPGILGRDAAQMLC